MVDSNSLLILAVILIAGALGGELARKVRLPSVTGQILAGMIMGPSLLGIFSPDVGHDLKPFTHFALGLIAMAVGNHLNLTRLRNAGKRLLWLLLFESMITPALVFAVVWLMPGSSLSLALLLGAMAVSTAPATIVAIVSETRSKGIFVKTLVAAVALNNIMCILLFELAYTAVGAQLDPTLKQGVWGILMAPLKELGLALLLGGSVAVALVIATRKVIRSDRLATVSIIAIFLVTGIADHFGLSMMLSALFLGVGLANLTPEKEELGHGVFVNLESAIFAVFFTLAGLELDLSVALTGGLLSLVVVTARLLGKVAAGNLAMRLASATERLRKYIGLGLIPQAGVAVGLIFLVLENPAFAPIHQTILAVGLTSVLANELIGPILTKLALTRSGDFGKDRARLIDFLHEEHIVTDFHAKTKEEAIEKLTDLLIQTHHLRVSRSSLLKSILDREREISTCIGNGVAIPHGILEKGRGDNIVGVMAISRKGLDMETPDGAPVHCMVLLATPPSQRNRHLEVLAALARAIGSDRNIQRQLFNSKSPAHVCDILHAEESEDFNYFMDIPSNEETA